MLFPWPNSLFNLVYISIMKFQACLTGRATQSRNEIPGRDAKEERLCFSML